MRHGIGVILLAVCAAGCAYGRLTAPRDLHGDHPQQTRGLALMGVEPNLSGVCDGHPPAEHRARATPAGAAVAAVSMGMIVPLRVEYACGHAEHTPPPTAAVALGADEPAYGPTPPPAGEAAPHAAGPSDHAAATSSSAAQPAPHR